MHIAHPQSEASYRVFLLRNDNYGIEVLTPDTEPGVVSGFATAATAEAWIVEQKRRVALPKAARRRFTP